MKLKKLTKGAYDKAYDLSKANDPSHEPKTFKDWFFDDTEDPEDIPNEILTEELTGAEVLDFYKKK